ncbi:MAG: Inosose dehydratase [candidate division BRC1 bacterium ADurb.BinA364]|nr:MAG: Inosose dehydratase [candidate division BRC1 bacterium ADurb.BinA364]
MGFRFACQTITFGAEQNKRFPEVFAAVARCGYTGVETGLRHLQALPGAEIKRMLDACGLKLAATHLGGNLEDPAQAAGEKTMAQDALDYIEPLGAKFIMYSGLKFESEGQLARDIDMISRSAALCKSRAVQLLYHNHAWEFENDWRIMNALIERSSADLGFCPDVGWVHKGGADVLEFLDKVKERVGAIHFKDFLTVGEPKDFCTLGEGVTPFPAIVDWMRANRPDLWVIAEQDKSDLDAEEAVRRNLDYMRRVAK